MLMNQEGGKTMGGYKEKQEIENAEENEEGKKKKRERQAGNTFLDIICILVDGFYHWFPLSTFRFQTLIRETQW